jgi:hypothetical protein
LYPYLSAWQAGKAILWASWEQVLPGDQLTFYYSLRENYYSPPVFINDFSFTEYMKTIAFSLLLCICRALSISGADTGSYNVKDFGASGHKKDNVTLAIQKAINACAQAGGGTVYFPAGDYTTATLFLKSHIRICLAPGATIFASRQVSDYSITKDRIDMETNISILFYGKELENVSFTGRGTIDGQAEHTWEDMKETDNFIKAETEIARASGIEMKRAFALLPRVSLFYLVSCKNVLLEHITVQRSPHWSVHIQWSQDIIIRGIRLFSSLSHGVNSDGIDIDGCRSVIISDCIIETGDDAICLKSTNQSGKYESVENVTVTNCVLTSTSCALKIGTETHGDFRHILFTNCIIKNANRGLGIFVRDGGHVEDVQFANISIQTQRKHFNWWGDGDAVRFVVLKRTEQSKVGSIQNIRLENITAGVEGTSLVEGFAGQSIQNIQLNRVTIRMNPESTADKRATDIFRFNQLQDLRLTEVDLSWNELQTEPKWQSALNLENISGLRITSFSGKQAPANREAPAVRLHQVENAIIERSVAGKGTGTFLNVSGEKTKNIRLSGNYLEEAEKPVNTAGSVPKSGQIQVKRQ